MNLIFDKRKTILETDRLILRRMNRDDASDMFEYACLPEITKYLLWAPHESMEDTKRYLKSVEVKYKENEFFDYGVILKSTDKFIGTCGIVRIDKPNSTMEVGYVINPAYQNQGYATEALRGLISHCINTLGYNRIEARFMKENKASLQVMLKAGMRFEGIARSALFVRDCYRDIGICSFIAGD